MYFLGRLVFTCLAALHGAAGSSLADEPKTLEEALLNFPWEYRQDERPAETLVFTKDGFATAPRFTWRWKITGPRTFLAYDVMEAGKRSAAFKCEMQLDEALAKMTGQAGRFKYAGRRLPAERVALRSALADPIQPGATWSGTEKGVHEKFTVLQRSGETFTARLDAPRTILHVTGTIQGNQLTWFAKDASPIWGGRGGDNLVTIKGDQLDFRWHAPNGKGSGTFTMKLESGTGAGPVISGPKSGESWAEVLRDQAPNALEWALAPLDRTAPDDIRQSLTFLREDLLDEAAQNAKASPAAYRLGPQLCGSLLAVLEERAQAQVRAGFRAVEADARTGVTSQALDARRNYKMSWPQFKREESQRAELKGQAATQAEVIKERPKLEWATRAAALRPALEAQYGNFRAALRQPGQK